MISFSSLLRIDLKRLILILAILTAIITLANAIYASYRVQRDLIINNTLEANRVYAEKLAESTQQLLLSTQQQLAYSAHFSQDKMSDTAALMTETHRLLTQTGSFNSTFIVSKDGLVLAVHPENLGLRGMTINSPSSLQAREAKRPIIGNPYMSAANNFVIVQSYPIFSKDNDYLGYIGGSFYLQNKSILNTLLDAHFYRDSSYLYVVDKSKKIIYHPDRVGEVISGNAVINSVIEGNSGAQRVINSKGIDMLAGYAPVPLSNWGVVTQKPLSAVLVDLNKQVENVIINTVPLALITLLFIWYCSSLISKPLKQLACIAEKLDSSSINRKIHDVHSWYFEADQIKQALSEGVNLIHKKIDKLNLDTLTDHMTELFNRRGLKMMLEQLEATKTPFTIIALDIDHFKQINDTFGHDIGDNVIEMMAKLMSVNSRSTDTLCRTGGKSLLCYYLKPT